MFFAPSLEEEISDYLAQGWFIRVLTVIIELPRAAGLWEHSQFIPRFVKKVAGARGHLRANMSTALSVP